MMDTDQLSTS